MKNILVIDSAINCTYDIFAIENTFFYMIFPDGNDIEFVEDFYERINDEENASKILSKLWDAKVDKQEVNGIHGTLFYGLADEKRQFYPTKKESEMITVIPK